MPSEATCVSKREVMKREAGCEGAPSRSHPAHPARAWPSRPPRWSLPGNCPELGTSITDVGSAEKEGDSPGQPGHRLPGVPVLQDTEG